MPLGNIGNELFNNRTAKTYNNLKKKLPHKSAASTFVGFVSMCVLTILKSEFLCINSSLELLRINPWLIDCWFVALLWLFQIQASVFQECHCQFLAAATVLLMGRIILVYIKAKAKYICRYVSFMIYLLYLIIYNIHMHYYPILSYIT